MGTIAPKIGREIQVVVDGDMGADVPSDPINLLAYNKIAIQAVWTGTPSGDLILEVSNNGTNWTAQGSPVATGGAPGDAMITEQFAPWTYARLFFDRSGGTGVLNAFATVKE